MIRSGGEEVLLDVGGQDSTEAFEDVGHSDEAREILEGLLVGTLKREVRLHPAPISHSNCPYTNPPFLNPIPQTPNPDPRYLLPAIQIIRS